MGFHNLTFIFLLCVSGSLLAVQANEKKPDYQIDIIAEGLEHPWSLAFLPDSTMLVTERAGRLLHLGEKTTTEVKGLPDDIYVAGQGGLQEVVLHPDFSSNHLIYLSYSAGSEDKNALKVVRGVLQNNLLTDIEPVFTVAPYKGTPVHYGARMVFLPDKSLLITTGDGFDYREDAQRLNNQLGKIIRLNDDGSIPRDNPYIGETEKNLAHAVYSYGHRNPQGLVYHHALNMVIAHEHGPAGGDEINFIAPGKNYGWPVVTNGRDYSGASISPFKQYSGMEQPAWDWTPSIAPSGMAVYSGSVFEQLEGDLLVGALKDKDVKWMQMVNGKIVSQVSLFSELDERIRDVRVNDGEIFLLTDDTDGKVIKVSR